MHFPDTLAENLRNHRVVPFVGAGVSMAVRDRVTGSPLFPTWSGLLMAAAGRLDKENKSREGTLVRSLLEIPKPDLLDAAKRVREALGAVWYALLRETLDVPRDRVDDNSLELVRCIWRLGSGLVITTNYDHVLRWSCPRADDLRSWDIEAPAEQAQLLQTGVQYPTIWHLHGRISNVAGMILTPDGYNLLYPEANQSATAQKYEAALQTLRSQLAAKSFLFVGFSLDDDYFGMQLRGIDRIFKGASGPHYVLVREAERERIARLNLPVDLLTFSDFGDPLIALLKEMAVNGDTEPADDSRISPRVKPTVADFGPHHSVFNVPYRQKGDQVVGQENTLQAVRKQLTEGRRTAIGQTAGFSGLGGLGKTQLAVEYAYRYKDEYPNGVIWINADQEIDAQLTEIAEKARWIAPETEHKYKLQIAQQRLRSYSDCLIIFDNLVDRAVIEPYLPEPEADPHILVTSRTDHSDFLPVPVDLLNEDLSLELLTQEAGRPLNSETEEAEARAIARALGGLPLALELAGAYLSHRADVTFGKYRELLNQNLKFALPGNLSSFTGHEADLYHTLKLSEDLLKEEAGLRDVLDLLTWSGSAPMGISLMCALAGVTSELELTKALSLGTTLRVFQKSETSDSYALHRLVSEVRREEIPLEDRKDWVNEVSGRIGDWFQERRKEFSQLPALEAEIDHLKAWHQNASFCSLGHSSRLTWLQGYPAFHRGLYSEARDYVVSAQTVLIQRGENKPELEANLLNDLASTDASLGDYKLVIDHYQKALTIRRELFGEIHADVALSLSNIGNAYDELGESKRALEFGEQALAIRRKLFGEIHADVASSLSNIGNAYDKLGESKRALEYGEQALAIRRKLFGESHPDVASSLNNIGSYYSSRKDSKRGLEYGERALTILKELFGERHPQVAVSLSNVGTYYSQLGDATKGLEYSRRALRIQRELFGERHPGVALSLYNVGRLYHDLGEQGRALEYMERALAMWRALLGDQHPLTVAGASSVATGFVTAGRRAEAFELVEEFLSKLPPSHSDVDEFKRLEKQLLSKSIRPGFRQPSRKRSRAKTKKKRK